MITYRKYVQKKRSEDTKTTLEVKLRFKGETDPKNKDNIKGRIRHINNYLRDFEHMHLNNGRIYRDSTTRSRKLIINELSYRLGFDIKVSSSTLLEPEKMLDLDALNNYILTGDYPQILKKEYK